MIKHTPRFLRQRRLLTVLPVLTLPFLTGLFWALGGGKGARSPGETTAPFPGFNTELPGARLGAQDQFDKLSFYAQAQRDSLKRLEAQRNDPYAQPVQSRRFPLMADTITPISFHSPRATPGHPARVYPASQSGLGKTPLATTVSTDELADSNEEKVRQKLAQLQQEMAKTGADHAAFSGSISPLPARSTDPAFKEDVDRLERMMTLMGGKGAPDPEMQQLEGTLEKILDIQHPERVQQRIGEQSLKHAEGVYPVEVKEESVVSWLSPQPREKIAPDTLDRMNASAEGAEAGFYGLEEGLATRAETGQALAAVIPQTQTLTAGATVKLRLLSDCYLNGQLVPGGEFLYGTCALNNERLTIQVKTIRQGDALYPVSLSAYDLDGLEGLYVPGSLTRDAARQATGQSLAAIDLPSLDPSPQMRAASVGLHAVKGLLGRKVRQVRVTVKAGYRVLLRDTNSKE